MTSSRGRNRRVLVIDDDPRIWRTVRRILEPAGYVVVCVASPIDARLEQVLEPFDLAIIDVFLYGPEDGYDVARRFAREWPSLRVLIVSGDPGAQHAEGLDPGLPFLAKPWTPSDLLAAVYVLTCGGNGHAGAGA